MTGRHSSKKQNMKSIKTNPKIISPLFLFQDLWKNIINENIILCFLQQEVSSDWKTKGSVRGNISLFMAVWTHSRGRGLCLGSFTINLYISQSRISSTNIYYWAYKFSIIETATTIKNLNVQCTCMYMYRLWGIYGVSDDVCGWYLILNDGNCFPHCCSQIPERALTKCPVDPIIVPAQIWFEINVEFVWSNSKMFVLLVSNILMCRQLTRQCATIDRPRIRQTLANR